MSEPVSRWGHFMDDVRTSANAPTPLEVSGTLTRLAGLVLEAVGLRVPVGSQCLIANGKREPVLSSGRKLRTHSAREMLTLLGHLFRGGLGAVKQRQGLDLWYAQRREDPHKDV